MKNSKTFFSAYYSYADTIEEMQEVGYFDNAESLALEVGDAITLICLIDVYKPEITGVCVTATKPSIVTAPLVPRI